MTVQRKTIHRLHPLLFLLLLIAAPTVQCATIKVVGSNTLEPFLRVWAELAKQAGQDAEVAISTPGTSVAPQALSADKADLAAMNREMTNEELEAFLRSHGYYPTAIAVAIEAVAIYANPANPVSAISYSQLDALYSRNHGCGAWEPVRTWGQLGAGGAWKNTPIEPLNYGIKSAVRDYLNREVMCRDDFKKDVPELSQTAVLEKLASDKSALGYGRYIPNSGLKVLAIRKGKEQAVPLTVENIYTRKYRLQHYLYLYVNKPQDKPVPPAILDFLRIGLSKAGQQAVQNAGYIPLSSELVQRQTNKLK